MSDFETIQLIGGLFQEESQFGWWVSLQYPDGEEHQKVGEELFATMDQAESALDVEIDRISRAMQSGGAEVLSKNGTLYA